MILWFLSIPLLTFSKVVALSQQITINLLIIIGAEMNRSQFGIIDYPATFSGNLRILPGNRVVLKFPLADGVTPS
jgi:hypothetical protein